MSLPLWGQLQKALDDPRTIDEYIADKIAEHNADAEAHLVEGASLELHKKEGVIDHPEGSVVPDKLPASDMFFSPPLRDDGQWVTSGFVEWDLWGGSGVGPLSGVAVSYDTAPQVSFVRGTWPFFAGNIRLSNSFMYQVQGYATMSGDGLARVGLFSLSGNSLDQGACIEIESGQVRGVVRLGSTTYTTAWFAYDVENWHSYRIRWDPFSKLFIFRISGDLIGTIEISTPPTDLGTGYVQKMIYVPTGSDEAGLDLSTLLLSAEDTI